MRKQSFVSSEYMRFDFNYIGKISDEKLTEIELLVNQMIASSIESDIKTLPLEEAKKLGAKAFFNDKYGDFVRVVKFGDVSTEFCGGCHVNNTKDIGLFVIESEESVASGVRRIQGRTSIGAYKLLKEKIELLNEVRKEVNANSIYEIKDRVNNVFSEVKTLQKEYQTLKDQLASNKAKNLKDEYKDFKGYKVIIKYIEDAKRDDLLKLGDALKVVHKDNVVILVGGNADDLPILIFVSGKALEQNHAGNLVKELSAMLGGSGGGRDNMANGKGKDKAKLNEALKEIENKIK